MITRKLGALDVALSPGNLSALKAVALRRGTDGASRQRAVSGVTGATRRRKKATRHCPAT
jgi:hypothetical protein